MPSHRQVKIVSSPLFRGLPAPREAKIQAIAMSVNMKVKLAVIVTQRDTS